MEATRVAPGEREIAVERFVARVVGELEPLQLRYNEALWRASVTGDESHQEESARLDTEIRGIFARPADYAFVREALGAGGVSSHALQRQLVLLDHHYRAHQIPIEKI